MLRATALSTCLVALAGALHAPAEVVQQPFSEAPPTENAAIATELGLELDAVNAFLGSIGMGGMNNTPDLKKELILTAIEQYREVKNDEPESVSPTLNKLIHTDEVKNSNEAKQKARIYRAVAQASSPAFPKVKALAASKIAATLLPSQGVQWEKKVLGLVNMGTAKAATAPCAPSPLGAGAASATGVAGPTPPCKLAAQAGELGHPGVPKQPALSPVETVVEHIIHEHGSKLKTELENLVGDGTAGGSQAAAASTTKAPAASATATPKVAPKKVAPTKAR